MGVRAIVAAKSEAARRCMDRSGRADLTGRAFDIGGRAKSTVVQQGQHRDRTAKVVGHQQESTRRMDAYIRGSCPARRDGVE